MASLDTLLAPGATAFHGEAHDWQEAIRLAGQLLEDAGATTADYTAQMVRSVEDNGPYIVLAPGFALAHARPSEAVTHSALAWLRLETPVRFGHASNDPVHIVAALAATDSSAHLEAMKDFAKLLRTRREDLDSADSEESLRAILNGEAHDAPKPAGTTPVRTATEDTRQHTPSADSVPSKGKILTVCGNGLGTSLFLKNTLEQVLEEWGWAPYLTVEATDTISAKGRAGEADFLLTSGAIAATLGDVGVPVYVVDDFTSTQQVDTALRELYDI
ncbi:MULTISPECIES: PTS sugar transporter subunit IIA [Corynebacterium]|uniref:PTS sugar transporter subunit IIA n=1 Tax=Corynebacterium TaxID=1716 RepID=UPI00124E56A3|nr:MULTISPECIES: PTS sugar transporter subunit IIA [Corynebacterium]